MARVLWWGRTERDYSRNRIVRHLFERLGFQIQYFHPFSSQLGLIESFFRRPERPDLMFVPCFRHRDITDAAFMAKKWNIPLILDPLISAYEKEIHERKKWPPESRKANGRKKWESRLFSKGDVVIADTEAHATFFHKTLGVPREKLHVLYVSAEPDLFKLKPAQKPEPPFELLFYGSFLELHGVDIIIEAAKLHGNPEIRWVLMGEGDIKSEMISMAKGFANIHFEPWIPYESLPDRISQAHILLGVFGPTVLTDLVIPNKIFQSMAIGRPIITSRSSAYNDSIAASETIGWVSAGDHRALADKVHEWLKSPACLDEKGRQTRELFDTYFSMEQLTTAMQKIISKAHYNFGQQGVLA